MGINNLVLYQQYVGSHELIILIVTAWTTHKGHLLGHTSPRLQTDIGLSLIESVGFNCE